MRRLSGPAVMALAALFVTASASNASAQCGDPSKHFRGGIAKHWIFQLTPGPSALEAVHRIIDEINVSRAQAGLPLLVFDPEEPVQVAVMEENNPRGPDGAVLLPDRLPNQEISLVTFAEMDGAFNGEVAVFLTDPLRSNAVLTAKGVPGAPAAFEREISSEQEEGGSKMSTHWVARGAGEDRIDFQARYSGDAIAFRSRFPGTAAYLNCNMAHLLDVLYRSRPTETFQWFDRYQVSLIGDLTRSDVDVRLKVRHHDPDVNAIFNDPANQPLALGEFDRVFRLQRP